MADRPTESRLDRLYRLLVAMSFFVAGMSCLVAGLTFAGIGFSAAAVLLIAAGRGRVVSDANEAKL